MGKVRDTDHKSDLRNLGPRAIPRFHPARILVCGGVGAEVEWGGVGRQVGWGGKRLNETIRWETLVSSDSGMGAKGYAFSDRVTAFGSG